MKGHVCGCLIDGKLLQYTLIEYITGWHSYRIIYRHWHLSGFGNQNKNHFQNLRQTKWLIIPRVLWRLNYSIGYQLSSKLGGSKICCLFLTLFLELISVPRYTKLKIYNFEVSARRTKTWACLRVFADSKYFLMIIRINNSTQIRYNFRRGSGFIGIPFLPNAVSLKKLRETGMLANSSLGFRDSTFSIDKNVTVTGVCDSSVRL